MTTPATVQDLVVTNLLANDNMARTFQVRIDWSANSELDVVKYNIYRSYVPYGTFGKIAEVAAPTVTYTDTPSLNSTVYVPGQGEAISQSIDGIWYYKVTAVNSLDEESTATEPISYQENEAFDENLFPNPYIIGNQSIDYSPDNYFDMPDNEDLKEYFQRMRYNNLWLLYQNGQEVLLYKRKREGAKCPHWDNDAQACAHPLGINNSLVDACYNTGILGGYYEPIRMRLRFVSSVSKVQIEREGMRIKNTPRSWTIWTPLLSNFDFFITSDGARYEITDVNRHRCRGGLITHQDFEIIRKWETDLINYVPVPTPLR